MLSVARLGAHLPPDGCCLPGEPCLESFKNMSCAQVEPRFEARALLCSVSMHGGARSFADDVSRGIQPLLEGPFFLKTPIYQTSKNTADQP